MREKTKLSQNNGSVLRPILAALLMLGGLGLLARAGGLANQPVPAATSTSGYPQAPAASPGVPRFFNYTAPAGIADAVGEPSIGCNWKSEQNLATACSASRMEDG